MVHGDEDEEIAEQKLWRAVIANTVREWIRGPLHRKRAAEQFLFRDDQDYRTVCFSAGSIRKTFATGCKKFVHARIQMHMHERHRISH